MPNETVANQRENYLDHVISECPVKDVHRLTLQKHKIISKASLKWTG